MKKKMNKPKILAFVEKMLIKCLRIKKIFIFVSNKFFEQPKKIKF